MSLTVGIVQGHNTRGIVAFLPIAFGLAVRACGCPQPRPPIKYGSVGEEKESLVMNSCPISMPAYRMLRWRACT